MTIEAKICGLTTEETVRAALDGGARYIGFVFYPPSPRNISFEQVALLGEIIKNDALKVGVFVNPDDELIRDTLRHIDLDVLQLHGNESIERIQYLKNKFSKIVMKAISVESVSDIARAREYEKMADMLLFDAKAPINMNNALPGGNGLEFDWNLIAGYKWRVPWMLSGGLNDKNVSEAIKISGAKLVDISSGIETEPGVKSANLINSFLTTVQDYNNE
ncbi:MAG: phosphoribosylanthranilate isomerase [Kordiimonadaceae bacterium]|jgi:phosphoribosylanthranilate isomerase|nr:phosphoribosylanthranilate isomerase [Kordiimonadaceae bacterium]MBT6031633.1 phosphoribosylanthranilate isomerase [Kordiimonadaceae bacterium]